MLRSWFDGTSTDELAELLEKERQLGIEPDEDIQAFMAACSLQGKRHSLATDYVLRMLGLDICADVICGSALTRGISGGQRKRLTAGAPACCLPFYSARATAQPESLTIM